MSISKNKIKIENVYNQDIEVAGRYLYTDKSNYSSYIATKKQTDEIVGLIEDKLGKKISILDIGCGDATFTFEYFQRIKPEMIIGFDLASRAIVTAKSKISQEHKNKIKFETLDIYNANKVFKKRQFDVGILRGVLHHLDNPKEAINSVAQVSDYLLVLEPNGYNPILKVIEKISPYHKKHNEKSYWPPSLEDWFRGNNHEIISQKYFGIVPYFCNKYLAMLLKIIEPLFENIPYLNKLWCSVSVTLYRNRQ